jgi:cell division septation protein DedD
VSDFSHDAADDAFHEIQLSGKQLVFLFMATTVVSVVIFLCGVLVGRGVRAEGAAGNTATSEAPVAPAEPPPQKVGQVGSAGSAEAPAAPALSYPQRLDGDKPVSEALKPRSDPPKPVAAQAPPEPQPEARDTAPVAQAVPSPARAEERPAQPAAGTPTAARSGVWVVQVQALRDATEAAAIVRRLSAKGYPAFVVNPDATEPGGMYRVHVGRYNDRAEAESVAARLKPEEKFSPWVRR